jgi:hypothetical protein
MTKLARQKGKGERKNARRKKAEGRRQIRKEKGQI